MQSNPCTFVTEPAVPQNAVYPTQSTVTVSTCSPLVLYSQSVQTAAVIAVLSTPAVLVDTCVLYDRTSLVGNEIKQTPCIQSVPGGMDKTSGECSLC